MGEHLDPPGQVAEDARRPAITAAASPRSRPPVPWTDDYSNLFQVLRVRPLPTRWWDRSPAPKPAETEA